MNQESCVIRRQLSGLGFVRIKCLCAMDEKLVVVSKIQKGWINDQLRERCKLTPFDCPGRLNAHSEAVFSGG